MPWNQMSQYICVYSLLLLLHTALTYPINCNTCRTELHFYPKLLEFLHSHTLLRTIIILFSLFLEHTSIAAFGLRLNTRISCFCFWFGVISAHHMILLAFHLVGLSLHSSHCLCIMILDIICPCLLTY
jgi:hypothetical protein